MMAGTKLDVIWSPVHLDKFIIWGPDITLYEVARLKDIEKKTAYTQISSTRGATVLASQSASGVRCVDISAIVEQPDPLLALGHSNGKVSLTSLKQTYDPLGLIGREFVPRYPRLCSSVSWSHVETNLLSVALEKHRSDHCILVWDVNRGLLPDESSLEAASPPTSSEPARPIAEMGLSETCHNVSWTNSSDRTLLASMNMKYIKVFDLRDLSNKAVQVATTRHCYGLCADPFTSWQLASRGDGCVCLWDARAFDRPLLTLALPQSPTKIQWCPTRRNLLMSLQRDSNTLRLHDIQQANNDYKNGQTTDLRTPAMAVEAELEEFSRGVSVIERDVAPGCGALASFSWHPAHAVRTLCVAPGSITDYTVCERVTCAWGAGLAWSAGGGALKLMQEDFYEALDDISIKMKRRALTDYGLKPDMWQNADLADDEALGGLWHFLALSKSLVEDGCIRNSPWRHPGVMTVLRAPGDGGYRSEQAPSLLPDLPSRRVMIYRSAERTRALQLCGWGWGWENAGAGVERAEAEGTPCRAAALAAFHLRLRTALDILARAAAPQVMYGWCGSADRTRALQLCGWGWGWENAGAGVERAEAEGTPCRAAALAAFHLRLRTALDILARAAAPQVMYGWCGSADRTRALQLCGWGWGWENAGAGVERAEAEGTPCRAAALAAFHLRLRTALDILARAAAPQVMYGWCGSADRTRALQLCGWGWGWENAGAGVERAEAEGTPCRAAALAAFHLRLRTALDILARAAAPQLRVVALALAGLSEERLWREALRAAAPALPDAYLRALLHFLAASCSAQHAAPPDLKHVLNETEMRLEDRVAFACMYLSDAKLHEYIQQSAEQLVQRGDLAGILLTGMGPSGVTLLQNWLENTGDVQSAALLAARCLPADLIPAAWLDSYRCILDSWQLWWARCALDTWVSQNDSNSEGVPRQVSVACTYCGKSVAAPAGQNRPRPAFARLPPPAAKMKQISSCPNCRKPLPRCGVCLLHLGTGAAGAGAGAGAGGASFAGWFSWCVACRHGGHAHHMAGWFREHSECPVSSCSCRCSSLDAPDRH